MPARDAEATLGEALASVREQTYDDFECLVVDDGSRDQSVAIAREVAARDARVSLLENDSPGLVGALNLGIRRARADWVARFDADDRMHPDRLRVQLAALLDQPAWVGAGCHVQMFPRGELGEGRLEYERWLNSMATPGDIRRERFVECPLAHPTWMFHRAVLREFPYRDMGGPEDYDLLLRLLGAGRVVGVVPRKLVFWRHQPRRLSCVDSRYEVQRFVELKAAHLASSFLRGEEEFVLVGYGKTGKQLSRKLRVLGHRPSHIVEVHPGRVGQQISGAPVVALEALEALGARRCIVCVAGLDARHAVRRELRRMGKLEERDFVCAA